MKVLSPEITTSQKPVESGLKTNTSLTERMQGAVDSQQEKSLLLHQKKTKTGAQTYALTERGKDLAKSIYSGLNATSAEILGESHALRAQINLDIREIKKSKRAALTEEWKLSGRKKTGSMDEFRSELNLRLANDERVQQYQLERKIISSVTQRVRAQTTRELRDSLRPTITDEQRQIFFQRLALEGKKIPASKALQDTLLLDFLVREKMREENVIEVAPTGKEQAFVQEVPQIQVPTAEEEQGERAALFLSRVGLRTEALNQRLEMQVAGLQKKLAWRWKMAQADVHDIVKNIRRKRTIVAGSALGVFSLAAGGLSPVSNIAISQALAAPVEGIVEMASSIPFSFVNASIVSKESSLASNPAEKEIAAQMPEVTKQQQEIQNAIQEYSKKFIFSTTIDTPQGPKTINTVMPFAESNYGYKGSGKVSVDDGKRILATAEANKQTWSYNILNKVAEYQKAEDDYSQYAVKETSEGRKPIDKNIFLEQKYGYDINTIFIWNIEDPYERAFYEQLREIGVYTDCSGAAYNFLRFAYDNMHGGGKFDQLIQASANWNINLMSSDRWFDQRISSSLGTPAVKDLHPGDLIGIKDAGGKIIHTLTVEGWENDGSNTYITVWQATDESADHGVFKYKVKVTKESENLPIHLQQWSDETGNEPKLAAQTTLGKGLSGSSFLNRLVHKDKSGNDVVIYTVSRLKGFETNDKTQAVNTKLVEGVNSSQVAKEEIQKQ